MQHTAHLRVSSPGCSSPAAVAAAALRAAAAAAGGDAARKPGTDATRDAFRAKKVPADVDYVFVGSGIGSMYCAALLAKCGKMFPTSAARLFLHQGCLQRASAPRRLRVCCLLARTRTTDEVCCLLARTWRMTMRGACLLVPRGIG